MSDTATPLDAEIDALQAEIDAAPLASGDEAEAFRVRFLGRKAGAVTALFGKIGSVPPEARRAVGQKLNALRQSAEARLDEMQSAASGASAEATDLDLTLPGRIPAPLAPGSLHPLTQTLESIQDIFAQFGFAVARGPEIEDDWHNFSALNFPANHPARDMQDTFFLEPPAPEGRGIVLRTHTSPVQVRVMEEAVRSGGGPPIRVIAPGRVFRNEAVSFKSYFMFHQVEGLVIDEGVSFADLKAVIFAFARAFFGGEPKMRFRPSFFPFTEPSAEVDVWWEDESLPGGGRWLEILGCGMVDPNVLDSVGIDSERYTGYAFGMGVERMAQIRYDVDDIRLYYENDQRFLRQF
ncbi:phenylalanine--tRNA ligase subunit alpha [Rubricoccus marinus]|uniref:Phenylalanine--tRNA ligase alpha subunit n=1 Tax=Rubricoccus marinus TaxID=716817 RepID=A0A259TUY4_9BACT|nr:phenylalanine--tRNA ligase subunit alpha [Rubricoccus marinus]OZC01575.1 phenylalanine--tRNA ligase subunit alpha [Rubricoccus marinus]